MASVTITYNDGSTATWEVEDAQSITNTLYSELGFIRELGGIGEKTYGLFVQYSSRMAPVQVGALLGHGVGSKEKVQAYFDDYKDIMLDLGMVSHEIRPLS